MCLGCSGEGHSCVARKWKLMAGPAPECAAAERGRRARTRSRMPLCKQPRTQGRSCGGATTHSLARIPASHPSGRPLRAHGRSRQREAPLHRRQAYRGGTHRSLRRPARAQSAARSRLAPMRTLPRHLATTAGGLAASKTIQTYEYWERYSSAAGGGKEPNRPARSANRSDSSSTATSPCPAPPAPGLAPTGIRLWRPPCASSTEAASRDQMRHRFRSGCEGGYHRSGCRRCSSIRTGW